MSQPADTRSQQSVAGSVAGTATAATTATTTATTATTIQSLADNLLIPLQPFEWSQEDSLTLVKHYNTESLESAKNQSKQFDAIVHKWIADAIHQRGAFFTQMNLWTDQLFRRHPISSFITQLRMRRATYSTSSIAYIILLIANFLKVIALVGSVLFFFARHSPSLLPEFIRPLPPTELNTWTHFFYTYTIGFVVNGALNAAQATVDIGYSIAIACFIWVLSSYASITLHNYSAVIQRRHSLYKLEQQFLTDFRKLVYNQLVFYLKPVIFDAYRAFLAFPIAERAQLLGAYTRQDPHLQTVHHLLLNECEGIAYSPYMEAECTKRINDDALRQMVELESAAYIDCYMKFKESLQEAGKIQFESLQSAIRTSATSAGMIAKTVGGGAVVASAGGLRFAASILADRRSAIAAMADATTAATAATATSQTPPNS
jgi:hypothetical protein